MIEDHWKYFIPIYGMFIYPLIDKKKLLADNGDDAFKLLWSFYHLSTTVPLAVLIIIYFIFL